MQTVLPWIQIVLSILLIVAILMQQRGAGSSGLFGGVGGVYQQRRGMERYLFVATIILSILFLASALVSFLW